MGNEYSLVPRLSEGVFVNGSGFAIVPGWESFTVVFFNRCSKEIENTITFFSTIVVISFRYFIKYFLKEVEEDDFVRLYWYEKVHYDYERVEVLPDSWLSCSDRGTRFLVWLHPFGFPDHAFNHTEIYTRTYHLLLG